MLGLWVRVKVMVRSRVMVRVSVMGWVRVMVSVMAHPGFCTSCRFHDGKSLTFYSF